MVYVTAIHTVSMVPVTTIGTSTGYTELPTSCIFADGGISCTSVLAPVSDTTTSTPPSTTAAQVTVTPIPEQTSSYTASTSMHSLATPAILPNISTSSPTTMPSSTSTTSATPVPIASETSLNEPASHPLPHQTGLALGVGLTILVLLVIGYLVLKWKDEKSRFGKKHQATEESALAMSQLDKHPRGSRFVVPTAGLSRSSSTSTHYTKTSSQWEPEKRFRGDVANRADSMGSFGQYKPPLSLDHTGSEIFVPPTPLSPYGNTCVPDFVDLEVPPPAKVYRPGSIHSFAFKYSHHPPTPPPSSPLPPVPGALDAILSKPSEDRRSPWYRKNFPSKAEISSEIAASPKPPQETLYGLGSNGINWSVDREIGSQPALSRQNSDESDVKRSQFDRVTGFEYLGLEKGKEGGKKTG